MSADTKGSRLETVRALLVRALSVLLCLFTLVEVNYPRLSPQSQLALFALFGLVLCFLHFPLHPRLRDRMWAHALDLLLALATVGCCLYVVVQTEPLFESWWIGGRSLGDRAGAEAGVDFVVGGLGVLLVLEATRRCVGLALPLLSIAFLVYARFGPALPDGLFPHRGYGVERIVSQVFLHSQGVFGFALKVMFTYVFLFVLFGSFLEATGATQFIIDYARSIFRRSAGGPAKVSVLSSGLMGSLSGSAVANTATTGTFTIPLMRSAGFRPHIAAGVEAAASSGGALVPPVMGAGAFMMLEIIDPPVTYLQIIKAALLPACLYYLSLFLIVHFYSRRIGAREDRGADEDEERKRVGFRYAGLLFFGALGSLILFLLPEAASPVSGFTVFRAVTLALGLVVVLSLARKETRITLGKGIEALVRTSRAGVSLIAAAACVGLIIGVVTLTGIGTKLPATILPLAQENLFLALLLIMVSSIILGMGLPLAVCYLLMATLIGPALSGLGVVPLAAHLFIFYFGMMSMVTPPVALAAYTAASIADCDIMRSGLAAFRFALVGFTLPYMFVLRPELLLLTSTGEPPSVLRVFSAVLVAVLGIVPLAGGIAGYLVGTLSALKRATLLLAAALLLYPAQSFLVRGLPVSLLDVTGFALLVTVLVLQVKAHRARTGQPSSAGDLRPRGGETVTHR